MNYRTAMSELKKRGTAQNRKVYARHGVGSDMYGVSFADLGKLKKTIKTDTDLARKLWDSGNHDARILAAMVADAGAMTGAELESWLRDLDNYVVTGAFSELAAAHPGALKKAEKWCRSKKEWPAAAGWHVIGRLAANAPDLPDASFAAHLEAIEKFIHEAKNRVRYSMNNAVISIALRSAALEKKAIAAARRIGKVEVDHGETGCKTPDAVDYIAKTKARRARKKSPARKSAPRKRARSARP